jgi:hypothetical protein
MSKKATKVKSVKTKSLPARIKKVRTLIQSAGGTIGSVEFTKRSNGEVRKMAYKLRVQPTTKRKTEKKIDTRSKDIDNLQMTVFDTNARESKSSYRVIPLENVTMVRVKGVVHNIS